MESYIKIYHAAAVKFETAGAHELAQFCRDRIEEAKEFDRKERLAQAKKSVEKTPKRASEPFKGRTT